MLTPQKPGFRFKQVLVYSLPFLIKNMIADGRKNKAYESDKAIITTAPAGQKS
jgi:hypothetical protein